MNVLSELFNWKVNCNKVLVVCFLVLSEDNGI